MLRPWRDPNAHRVVHCIRIPSARRVPGKDVWRPGPTRSSGALAFPPPRDSDPFMNVTRYRCSVLAVDDEPAVLAILKAQLGADFEIITATNAERARAILAERSV